MVGWMRKQSRTSTAMLACLITMLTGTPVHAGTVAQAPLFLEETYRPNILFVMSVETPMGGAAYNDQLEDDPGFECDGRVNSKGVCYTGSRTYLGHFDPRLCYDYIGSVEPTLSINAFDSEETGSGAGDLAQNAIDGDSNTIWHTQWRGSGDPPHPHYIEIDMGAEYELIGLSYEPRTNAFNGTIGDYEVYLEATPIDFDNLDNYTPVASGTWTWDNDDPQRADFNAATGRYLTLVGLSEAGNRGPWTSAAEIMPIEAPAPEDYFTPKALSAEDHSCSGSYWSGNFLNWATMTAMDAFIYTTTGGNRVVDTSSQTIVKRARKHHNGNWFPIKRLQSGLTIATDPDITAPAPSTVTPFSDNIIDIENTDYGFIVRDSAGNTLGGGEYTVQVELCNTSITDAEGNPVLDSKCSVYGDNASAYYKPEGLIQQNAENMRFGVMGYTRHTGNNVHGGVLRAPMKHVPPFLPDNAPNSVAEFDSDGILISDPENRTSEAGVDYSGVINYINKFSDYGYKRNDPVSELFYEAVRYYKGLGPTPEYYNDPDFSFIADPNDTFDKGGFALIDDYANNDPIQHQCQSNFIVALNDAYPHKDKRLPGTYFTSANFPAKCSPTGSYGDEGGDCGEPSNPDPSINVRTLANTVGDLQEIGNIGERLAPRLACTDPSCASSDGGRENTYYVAGLAYHANTTDFRSGMRGVQNVRTFMIDSQEFQSNPLVGEYNQLWLTGKYGGFIDEDGNKKPNLASEWDEDGDGQPDNYVLASRPEKMVQGLKNAFDFVQVGQGSATAVAVEVNVLRTDSAVYQALFYADDWSGELRSLTLDQNGNIKTKQDTDDEDGDDDTMDQVPDWQWRASDEIPSHLSRRIYTWRPDLNAGKEFLWGADDSDETYLSVGQKSTLNNDQNLLSYLRGDQSNEFDENGVGSYRRRTSLLGDIVNSSPVYVKESPFPYSRLPNSQGGNAHPSFVTTTAGRQGMVYASANDGMLHAFNADTGVEEFAYIPSMIIPNLKNLANSPYAHQYFVDGPLYAGDAYLNNAWKTVLTGSLGAGGFGVFGLDITDPDTNFSAGNILWEFTHSELGYVLGEVQTVLLNNGTWAAIFNNGYSSPNGKAGLFIKSLDGSALNGNDDFIFIDTGTSANGLSEPLLVDVDFDLDLDYVYAGDVQGNLWKFDLSSNTPSNWDVAFYDGNTAKPLFSAVDGNGDPQVITVQPAIVRRGNLLDEFIVLFGTGKFFENGDNIVDANPPIETVYGILDNGSRVTVDRTGLQERRIELEATVTIDGETTGVRAIIDDEGTTADDGGADDGDDTNDPMDFGSKSGWYLDLLSPSETVGNGERVINRMEISGRQLILKTYIPPLDCRTEAISWLMSLNPQSGARFPEAVIDLNGDGEYNESDFINIGTEANPVLIPVSGVKRAGSVSDFTAICSGAGCDQVFVLSADNSGNEIENDPFEGLNHLLYRRSWRQLR